MATPYALVYADETISTQDDARRLIDDRPMLVVARRQTGGRGRSGAEWLNADSSLAVSLALRPSWDPSEWPRLTLAAGVAAIEALDADVGLKWPNDLVRDGRKLAGILTEVTDGVAVVGWGTNLVWRDPPEGMGGVYTLEPEVAEAQATARRWAERLLDIADRPADEWPLEDYRAACTTLGREITWQPAGRGRAIDVAADGALVVETPDGTTTVAAGAVTEVRPAG